jgi:hypothetical protein
MEIRSVDLKAGFICKCTVLLLNVPTSNLSFNRIQSEQ